MLSTKHKVLFAIGSLVAAVVILSAVEAVVRYYRADICQIPCLVGDMVYEEQIRP